MHPVYYRAKKLSGAAELWALFSPTVAGGKEMPGLEARLTSVIPAAQKEGAVLDQTGLAFYH